MKNIFKIITILLFAAGMTACTKNDDNQTYYPDNNKSPRLEIQPTTATLDETRPDDIAIIVTWEDAVYSFDAAIEYTLQIALAGRNMEGAIERIMPAGKNFTYYTYAQLNDIILAAGATGGETAELQAQLTSNVKMDVGMETEIKSLYSNIVDFTVRPYEAPVDPEIPKIFVPGDYQGWNPGNAPVLYSVERNEIYTGYVYFNNTGKTKEFKFALTPNWDNAKGTDLFTGLEGSVDDPGNSNFRIVSDNDIEVYYIVADFNTNIVTVTPATDWVGDPRNHNWGVIGSAVGGWDPENDQMLTFNEDNNLWEGSVDFAADEYKFRADQDWGLNLGGNSGDALSGNLWRDGGNLSAPEAGTYRVILDLRCPDNYNFTLEK